MKSTKNLFEDLSGAMSAKDRNVGIAPVIVPQNWRSKYQQAQTSNVIRAAGNELQGVKLFDFNFRPWQQTLVNALGRGGNVYQVASPGAGKTAPVVFHWATAMELNPNMDLAVADPSARGHQYNKDAVIQINKLIVRLMQFFDIPRGSLNQLPTILYLCPVRQLVYEIRKDFTDHISKIIYHLIHIAIVVDNNVHRNTSMGLINIRLDGANGLYDVLSRNGMNVRPLVGRKNQLYKEMQHFVSTQINDSRANKLAKDIQLVDHQIMKTITDRLKTFIEKNIISIKTKEDSISNIDAPIMITIYQSAKNVFKKMDKKNLRLLVLDESHLTQQIDPESTQAADITDSLYYILKNLNKTQLVLLSGTVNPASAKNLIDYLKTAMNINITRLDSGNEGRNPSNISVMPMDSLRDDNTLLKLMLNPTESNNVIIFFSIKKIHSLVDQALRKNQGHQYTADQIEQGDLQQRKRSSHNINLDELEKDDPKNIRDGFNINRNKFLEAVNKIPGANEISDEKLLQAVMNGFGYIHRVDTGNAQKDKAAGQDAQIVANLFSKGKIKTLLATNAVGIGINLTIKNMYVPQTKRFDGQGMVDFPISDSSQLYNRTGRMAFTTSSIYTPKENVNDIIKAISATNNNFDMRETLGRFKQTVNPNGAPMMFGIAWRGFSDYIAGNMNHTS